MGTQTYSLRRRFFGALKKGHDGSEVPLYQTCGENSVFSDGGGG